MLQPALPRLLRFSPPCFGSSRKRSSSGSTEFPLGLLNRLTFCPSCCPSLLQRLSPSGGHLPLGFLNRFPLCRHPLCNPGSNVGKSLGAHLPLGLLCGFSRGSGPSNLRPPCSDGSSNSSTACSTHLLFLPLRCGRLSCLGRSGYVAAQELTEFFLQRLDLLLDVGCFT